MRHRHLRSAVTFVVIGAALAACTVPNPNRRKDGSVDDDPDASIDGPPVPCTQTTCAGDMLTVCVGGTVDHVEACPLGCFSDQSRCNKIVPSNALGDLLEQSAQLAATTLPSGSVINTDNGSITAPGAPPVVSSTTVAQSGGPMVRVMLARSWTLNDVRIQGSLPVAFVAAEDITIQGLVDASADASTNGPGALICGSSGGGGSQVGGSYGRRRAGSSPGYPTYLWSSNGYGGGGFGSGGGVGGIAAEGLQVGASGAPNGNTELVPLRGGCEGGGDILQHRGAGGGAVQIVSGRAIHVVASGTNLGGIHVGGGGAAAAALGTNDLANPAVWAPGGGGSGGGILMEAPSIILDDKTMLLATGGGGGGYGACNPGPDGTDAPPNTAASSGGRCSQDTKPTSLGGDGATTGPGGTGQNGSDLGGSGGGGGGGLGRIRINTATGEYTMNANSVVRGVVTTGMVGRR